MTTVVSPTARLVAPALTDTLVRVGSVAVACPYVAVQLLAASIVTLAVGEVPSQSPLQPVKIEPLDASAISVTSVPSR